MIANWAAPTKRREPIRVWIFIPLNLSFVRDFPGDIRYPPKPAPQIRIG